MTYLYEDPAVAGSTPPAPAGQAIVLLELGEDLRPLLGESADSAVGEDGRAMLATKLARLLPDLSRDKLARVEHLALRALETLARDQAVKVREALAGAIKDVACAPHGVCLRLARDIERSVAEPILRYCMTLTDDDLRMIINGQPAPWSLSAIARRDQLSEPVSDAVFESGDTVATGALIDNPGARIAESTLSRMVDESIRRPEWQGGLARRTGLPAPLALRLAHFVDQSVLEFLRGRRDIDSPTARMIVAVARRRLDWLEATVPNEPPGDRARRLLRAGLLDDDVIGDALSWTQIDFVRTALALLARLPLGTIDAILKSRSPRGVTALAWRAGLSMRTAVHLQSTAAMIPPRLLLNARDGTAYPLSEAEMSWQLELFGILPNE
ncbi:MAG: DUF2336 domain-containing protein [Azospirillum sp.]|nr:DUF2336 domain-containing protein [Azospirillum sp.]